MPARSFSKWAVSLLQQSASGPASDQDFHADADDKQPLATWIPPGLKGSVTRPLATRISHEESWPLFLIYAPPCANNIIHMPSQRHPRGGSAARRGAGRGTTARAENTANKAMKETPGNIQAAKTSKRKSKNKSNRKIVEPEVHNQTDAIAVESPKLSFWRIMYMAVVGFIAFATGTAIGVRTKLAIPEYSSSMFEEEGTVKASSIWALILLLLLAFTLILSLIFSFFLMESARWRKRLAERSVLVAYPLGLCNGLVFGHNICYAAGLTRSDCSGAVVGLLLLSYVVMILAKMLYLILKDVIGWEEIQV